MTEAEWLAATDPEQMLKFIQSTASHRKLRLFAVASALRVFHLMESEASWNAVRASEQHADGVISETDLLTAYSIALEEQVQMPHNWSQIFGGLSTKMANQRYNAAKAAANAAYKNTLSAAFVAPFYAATAL